MANNNSQKKRNRQNEKRRAHNSIIKSSLRTAQKKVLTGLKDSGNIEIESIELEFKNFVSKIDTAAKRNILHKNNAAKKKSRLAKKINQMKQKAAV